MAFSNILSPELCAKLSAITADELGAVIKAASLGLSAQRLHECIHAVNSGESPELPEVSGSPKPVTVQAWSFVKDRGQYADTYQLSSAQAGEIADLLLTDVEKGIAEITAIVTSALRRRGSARPVAVSTAGMPATRGAPPPVPGVGNAGRGALKEEIRSNAATYGLYKFDAEDTGRPGSLRYRVRLGGGLYATHPSKTGAIDVARICRVKGRAYPLIADRIYLWIDGKTPAVGSDIPDRVTFTGILPPLADLPADPTTRAKTESPASASETTTN
uniref:Capsid protein n=1 Tax=Pseudopestalotiopsis camelliae-sinensis polymycovirus 1 TaxID=3367397 RepID=A0AB74UMC1_9VIRU